MKRWRDIRAKGKSPQRLAAIEAEVAKELLEMDLREIRELAGKTQSEIADETGLTQAEISRFERREDFRLSTLKRYVEALGGELEIYATFGDKKVRLRSAA